MPKDDALLAEVAAHLNEWENVPPETPGHYWWRSKDGMPATVVRIQYDRRSVRQRMLRAYFPGDRHGQNPQDMGGQWFGPLEEPTDG